MKSILVDEKVCWLCGSSTGEHKDLHHVYGGGMRKTSEKYGLVVYLCHDKCHLKGVHADHIKREKLQDWSQRKAMEFYGWSMDDWMNRMYKNYLLED